jgi:hypothetical protein
MQVETKWEGNNYNNTRHFWIKKEKYTRVIKKLPHQEPHAYLMKSGQFVLLHKGIK